MQNRALTFNDKEFILLYMAVGSCYAEIREFNSSKQFESATFEVQEISLQNEVQMEKLYFKMKEHASLMYPLADAIFKRDTQKPRPDKYAQFKETK